MPRAEQYIRRIPTELEAVAQQVLLNLALANQEFIVGPDEAGHYIDMRAVMTVRAMQVNAAFDEYMRGQDDGQRDGNPDSGDQPGAGADVR